MSDSLQPHGLHHARLPCPSLSLGVCSNLCPLTWWCHPTISLAVAPSSSFLQSFPASRSFPELALHIRWPNYWSFSFSISPRSLGKHLILFLSLISLILQLISVVSTLWDCYNIKHKDFWNVHGIYLVFNKF